MAEDRPEQVLGQLGGAFAVGGGEAVLAGAAGAAKGRERAGVQAQGVTDIVEAEGVRELGEDQTHDMTPRTEAAGLVGDAGVPGQLGHEVRRNQMAELAQEGETAARWLAERLVVHPRPCDRVPTRKPTLFTSPNHHGWGTAVNCESCLVTPLSNENAFSRAARITSFDNSNDGESLH